MIYLPIQVGDQIVTDQHGVNKVKTILTTFDEEQVLLIEVAHKSVLIRSDEIVGTFWGCTEPMSGYLQTECV